MLQMAGRMAVLGTETAFEVLARANALAAQGRSIINLGIGQPDFPTPEHIVEEGQSASQSIGSLSEHMFARVDIAADGKAGLQAILQRRLVPPRPAEGTGIRHMATRSSSSLSAVSEGGRNDCVGRSLQG